MRGGIRGLELCNTGRYNLVFPFLRPLVRQKVRERKGLRTCWSSARTSSATPYSSNSCLMDAMTSSITVRYIVGSLKKCYPTELLPDDNR